MGNRTKKRGDRTKTIFINGILFRLILGLFFLIAMFGSAALAGEIGADVEKILRDIRQDQPVPAVAYLTKAEPVNVDCTYYRGNYRDIEISVETHPNSQRVASILLQIPGPDRTKELLPAVKRVIGPPRASNPKQSEYGWEWPKYRTASLHYVKGAKPGEGSTIVSIFYR
jgi:hypothetical protein